MQNILKQSEGRRLEFKASLPENAELAKTIIAFANDAGGDLFIGISDNPREVVGLPEDDLVSIEEKLSNIIFDKCYPAILPEIKFLSIDEKHIIQVSVFRGSTPPYYLKDKGKLQGTMIRVGSTNRFADDAIIGELERRKRNVSFDGEIVLEKASADVDMTSFKKFFLEKTGEELDENALKKLSLVQKVENKQYPTNAMILLSDDELQNNFFHYAKVECARFKGTSIEEFIDKKTIQGNVALQAEEAYNFVLRHINQGAKVEGVYTVDRWEYPVKAIREIIRNAIVHRDYSLRGKDVKVAIYDDMIEITSAGLLPPSIDYSAMQSRQSDARNKVLAPIFKRLGLIDQWGNGLKLVANELKQYPDIELKWQEVGLSFQVQFINKNFIPTSDVGINVGINVGIKTRLLDLIKRDNKISAKELSEKLDISARQCERIISELKEENILTRQGSKKSGYWSVKE